MKKKRELYRLNNELTDAKLIELSRMWHKLFNNHLSEFENFDSALNAAFAAAWLAKVEEFLLHPTDETTVDLLQDKTQTVHEQTEVVIGLVREVEYFVKRAFPNQPRKLLEFGFELLYKRRLSKFSEMLIDCHVLQMMIDTYSAPLLLAGMPATLPTTFESELDKLMKAVLTQERYKRQRILLTTQRITLFNELYSMHRQVAAAAQNVFANNKTIAAQFEV